MVLCVFVCVGVVRQIHREEKQVGIMDDFVSVMFQLHLATVSCKRTLSLAAFIIK